MERISIPLLAVAALAAIASCSERRAELPADLGGDWDVQQIAGASLGQGVRIDFAIDAQTGRLSGSTGCNAFSASMTAFENSISVGAVREEEGACADAASATDETRFLSALQSVQRYARHGDSLELLGPPSGEDALLRLRLADDPS